MIEKTSGGRREIPNPIRPADRRDLRPGCRRLAKTGGGVEVLAIITPQDQTHWLGVAEKMREEARETIEENFQIYSNWMKDELKLEAELVIREGEKATEVLNQISEDKEVGETCLGGK